MDYAQPSDRAFEMSRVGQTGLSNGGWAHREGSREFDASRTNKDVGADGMCLMGWALGDTFRFFC